MAKEFGVFITVGIVYTDVMSMEIVRFTGRLIEREAYGLLVEDLFKHYYTDQFTAITPLVFWWLGAVMVAGIPTSIYSHLTGVNTLPVSHPLGFLMISTMVGGLVVSAVAHVAFWSHGKYIKHTR